MTALAEIRDLQVQFTGDRTVYALNAVSLSLEEGEVLGLIGEPGSGKSVTLRALMRLLPPLKTVEEGEGRGESRGAAFSLNARLSSAIVSGSSWTAPGPP